MLAIIIMIWAFLAIVPFFVSSEEDIHWPWMAWILLAFLWIVPLFSGIHVQNNEGQYKGYVIAVEKNGAIFRGYNVFLKTELEASNEDKACINRNDKNLIDNLKKAQEEKKNVVLEYEGVWQYGIGECPGADWMIMGIKN